jgi:hypothetical protein
MVILAVFLTKSTIKKDKKYGTKKMRKIIKIFIQTTCMPSQISRPRGEEDRN